MLCKEQEGELKDKDTETVKNVSSYQQISFNVAWHVVIGC